MCLAVPMKIARVVSPEFAEYELGGKMNSVNISILDNVAAGEYVIIHAGFAIERLSADEAEKTLELFRQIAEMDDSE